MCKLIRRCCLSRKKIMNETNAFIRAFESKKRRFYTREKVGVHRNSPTHKTGERAKVVLPDIKDPKQSKEEPTAVEE